MTNALLSAARPHRKGKLVWAIISELWAQKAH